MQKEANESLLLRASKLPQRPFPYKSTIRLDEHHRGAEISLDTPQLRLTPLVTTYL
jgi:hypothetical protein